MEDVSLHTFDVYQADLLYFNKNFSLFFRKAESKCTIVLQKLQV